MTPSCNPGIPRPRNGAPPRIRPAEPDDVVGIADLLGPAAEQRLLLARSEEEIRAGIERFLVAEADRGIVGCVAVEPFPPESLAEIRSLAVAPAFRQKGVGKALVEAAIDRCRREGVRKVFVLTYVGRFFERFGFRIVSKGIFPQKVWNDCIRCPSYYHCDEDALLLDLDND